MKKIFVYFLFFFTNFICNASFEAKEDEQRQQLVEIYQPWSSELVEKYDDILKDLKKGNILYGISLNKYDSSTPPSNNKILLVKVADESKNSFIKVIFRPRELLHQKVEEGAYELAKILNMKGLVPPSISSEWKGQKGVLSYYIDVEDKLNFWKNKATFKKDFEVDTFTELVEPESLNNFYIFVQVFGMWDLKWQNTLLVGKDKPYQIMSLDNESLISPVYLPTNEHFFVCWKQDPDCVNSPYEDLSILEKFSPNILNLENIADSFELLKRFFIKDENVQKIESEQQKKEDILKRIKSFMWGKSSLPYYIGNKGWWLQLYDGLPSIPSPAVSKIQPRVFEGLQSLSILSIRECYQDTDLQKSFFSEEFYKNILLRRDKVLLNK